MPSTYSTSLRLELPGNGEQSGSWGQTLNKDLGTLLEQAITGVESIDLSGYSSYELSSFNGLSDEARNAVLVFTGTPVSNVIVTTPAVEKVYIISNQVSGYSVTVKTESGNGIAVLSGTNQLIYCDGTDYYTGVSVNSIFGDLTVSGDSAVSNATTIGGSITVNSSVLSSLANISLTANSNIVSMLPNVGGFVPPTGSTAQRPTNLRVGMARWNSDLGAYEIWNGLAWENISSGSYGVTYLIIAGGGGGGVGYGAGGGAGGLLTSTTNVIPTNSYTITVGAGGSAGSNGANSSALSLTAIGGGAGNTGNAGGSGGGGGTTSAGAGTSGQGFAGGAGVGSGPVYGGGGGGAGAVGQAAVASTRGGDGGNGVASDITGSSTFYAGGAGGTLQGIGGTAGTNGAGNANYGGGGGSYNPDPGQNGVVIIRYANPTQRASGGNVTSYTSGVTTYWVHTFTTSGTFIA